MSSTEEVRIVKGDTLNLTLNFTNSTGLVIDHIYFSCRNILTRDFIYEPPVLNSEGAVIAPAYYRLTAGAAETALWPAGRTSYDITIYFGNNTVHTVQYKGALVVLSKDNAVNLNG